MATFVRARQFVVPIAETETFMVDLNRLLSHTVAIAQTEGVTAAVQRLRGYLAAIEEVTGFVFTLTVETAIGDLVKLTITTHEWSATPTSHYEVSVKLVAVSTPIEFTVVDRAQVPVVTTASVTVVVPEGSL